ASWWRIRKHFMASIRGTVPRRPRAEPTATDSSSIRGMVSVRRTRGIVQQDADRRAIQIVILAAADRPQQHPKACQPHNQGGGDDQGHAVHGALQGASLKAFSVTSSEELAMAAAATRGVTSPRAASGMAAALYSPARMKFSITS